MPIVFCDVERCKQNHKKECQAAALDLIEVWWSIFRDPDLTCKQFEKRE